MSIPRQIQLLMEANKVSRYKLSRETSIPYTTLTQIINGRTKDPQVSALQTIAHYFNKPLDYLLGKSAGALIENRLTELGMTMEDLSEQTKIPLQNLQNLDNAQPGPWDYEKGGLIERVSTALGMDPKELRVAYTRQEPPTYDGPATSVEDAFGDIGYEEMFQVKEQSTPYTLTSKEERDIAIDLERMLSDLESNQALAFHGETLDEESKELLRISLENSLRLAKQMAKQKFTPKKHRK